MATPIPKNDATFDLEEILGVTGGTLVHAGATAAADPGGPNSTSVTTDSRAVQPHALFIALKGEAHDGHAHLAAVANAAAAIAIVEKDVEAPPGLGIVRVASTLAALGDLARAYARRWRKYPGEHRVIGITGSAGKTTMRVAASALLEKARPGEVLATKGNLNNLVGLPMMLFGLKPEHRFAVLEMGMNQPGEIARLAEIAEPDAGVLTLIAAAHVEGVGSIEGVAHEKTALLRALPESGLVVGNADDARVRAEIERAPAKQRALYGRWLESDVRIAYRDVARITLARIGLDRPGMPSCEIETPLLGEAGALACAGAVALVDRLTAPLDEDTIRAAFAKPEVGGGAGRLLPRECSDGLVVIDDSYNSNPASARASIRAAAEIAKAFSLRLVLVLGEMRELGSASLEAHEQVGITVGESLAAEVITIGGDARLIAERAAEAGIVARFFAHVGSALDPVLNVVQPGDLVLIKGSRSVGMERIAKTLGDLHDAPMTLRRGEPR